MITIVLAEDHHLVRKGLRSLLNNEIGFELIGEAADGLEAVHLAETLKPNILLLDLTLPRMHGLEVIRRLKGQNKTRIIVISMHSDQPYVMEALRNGAFGYILKDATPEELAEAVRAVANGGRYVSASLRKSAITRALRGTQIPNDPYEELTPRERLVLQHAAEGLSNSEIAAKLYISTRTVETHRANMLKKLCLRSQTDLVRYAIRRDIVPV